MEILAEWSADPIAILLYCQSGNKSQLNPAWCWQAGLNDCTVFHLVPVIKYLTPILKSQKIAYENILEIETL